MEWKEAFQLSTIQHRAPYLRYLTWVMGVQVRTLVEIGVNKGETSLLLRHLFPEAHLYLIDPWQPSTDYLLSGTPISRKTPHYEKAYAKVQNAFRADPLVTILRMHSAEALSLVPDNLDLVFIDANHEYTHVKADILSWLPKVREGGLITGHDYEPTIPIFSGVKRAVDEIFGKRIVLGKDRLWVHKKTMRERGLEPLRETPLPPQSSASTNSATLAKN